MRILFTGASSVIGGRVLQRILDSVQDVEVWCVRRQSEIGVSDSRVRLIDLDLTKDVDSESLPDRIDLVIHFAGVTHARDADAYWSMNLNGTKRLALAARARGATRFVYISTRCATPGAGAYGESKLAAEGALKQQSWDGLLIIRPSEVYTGQGKEGVDKLIALAQRWHLTPLLFGNSNVSFAPLWFEDFAAIAAGEIMNHNDGVATIEMCGPQDLGPAALASAIAKRYYALPVPVWWPVFAMLVKVALRFNLNLAVPDQLRRLTCRKTSSAMNADRKGHVRFLAR
jgi:nucleoside-diphosphate-sugar epimerase